MDNKAFEWINSENEGESSFYLNNIEMVEVGQYYGDRYIYISYESRLADLFDCEKKFLKLDKIKKYVEKEVRKWLDPIKNFKNLDKK